MKQIALLLLFSLSATVFADTKVNWYQWSSAAFAKAKKDNKLIMVYVGHEGCTACRFMETRTFADPRVIDLLNEHFVPFKLIAWQNRISANDIQTGHGLPMPCCCPTPLRSPHSEVVHSQIAMWYY